MAVTRGEGGEGPLTTLLRARGARVLDWGSIAFEPPEIPEPFISALDRLGDFDWICFSSPRAVEAVAARVAAPPEGVKIAAVGPTTAAILEERGWFVDRVPREGSGRGLVESFREGGDASGARIFFPASAMAREDIPSGLSELGAQVEQVTAYRMVTLPVDAAACEDSVDREEVQAVTFASPSAMEGLRAGIGESLFERLARETPAAAMGPTTAAALEKAGWHRVVVAETPTLEGLADAALLPTGQGREGPDEK